MQIKKVVFSSLVVFLALGLFLAFSSSARATVTITPASGGTSISADDYGTGSWTSLGAITIAEGAAGDIGTGTIILTAPSGFEFNTASAPDVAITGTTPQLAANTPASVTASQITITVTAASTSESDNVMTIGGSTPIQVRPTAGTPLASGNIYMDASSTSTINGVTTGSSGTNFGTLTEVVGAASKVAFTTQASTPSVANVAFATQPIVTIQDQYGNTRTADTNTVTLSGYTDAACTSAINAGALTGTLTEAAVAGIADFAGNGIKCSLSGNLWLKAEVSGLTTDCSSVIVVNPAPITDLSCEPSGQGGAVWLRWTVPYGIISTGNGYSGQYHSGNSVTWQSPITDNVAFGTSWARADQGTPEQELVTGMNPGTQYTFVMHVLGDDSTASADSNKVTCYAPSGAPLSSDTTAPTSYITEPANKSTILAGQPYIIKGTAIDTGGSSIQRVEVSLDGGATWHLAKITSVLDSNDLWEFTWSGPTTGEYIIKTRATDWVGNVETPGEGISITVASELPSEEVTPPVSPPAEKPVSEMTVTEIKAKIVELQQKVIDLLTQLLQMLQAQIANAGK